MWCSRTKVGPLDSTQCPHIADKCKFFCTWSYRIQIIFKQIYLDPSWYCHFEAEWTWEKWQWRDTPHSLELVAHHQKQFSVIPRTRLLGVIGLFFLDGIKIACSLQFRTNMYEVSSISFQTFFVFALLLIVHTSNSSTLRTNLLRLQCTYTVPTTSGRPHGSPLVWACQWPSSQPLSSPQLSHNDSL